MAISRKRQSLVEFCSKRLDKRNNSNFVENLFVLWGLIDSIRRSYKQNLLFKITSKVILSTTCYLNNDSIQNMLSRNTGGV